MPMTSEKKIETCSICGQTYTGFGNNAEPVNAGRCCDKCNAIHVIPARLRSILRLPIKRPDK